MKFVRTEAYIGVRGNLGKKLQNPRVSKALVTCSAAAAKDGEHDDGRDSDDGDDDEHDQQRVVRQRWLAFRAR